MQGASDDDQTNQSSSHVDNAGLYKRWKAIQEKLRAQRNAEDAECTRKRKGEDDEAQKKRKREDDENEKKRKEGQTEAKAALTEKHKADMAAFQTLWSTGH